MDIICTVGPSTKWHSMIRRLEAAGGTVFRLNLSHTEAFDEVKDFVDMIQRKTGGKKCLDTIGSSPFTRFDKWVLEYSADLDIDQVAISFTQGKEAIQKARELSNGAYIVAKIENRLGVENKGEIIEEADAVMIDRGDLSKSFLVQDIPRHCTDIISMSNALKTPVWVATNLLESMISEPRPTLSEVSDIQSLMTQGVAGLVLAGETAIGRYPVECVEVLRQMIERYE